MEVYAAEPEACRIEFHLDFEFTNKLIELAFGRVFKELAANMVEAFTVRAKRFTVRVKLPLRWLMRYLRSSTCSE